MPSRERAFELDGTSSNYVYVAYLYRHPLTRVTYQPDYRALLGLMLIFEFT